MASLNFHKQVIPVMFNEPVIITGKVDEVRREDLSEVTGEDDSSHLLIFNPYNQKKF